MKGNPGQTAAAAVLFDIDGTSVDSNYLHVHAWHRAFTELDVDVEAWRIHRRIGMGRNRGLAEPLPGALRLLDTVAALGLKVVLATSAPEDELVHLRMVLDRDDITSMVRSSQDLQMAKPRPEIVEVALERAGVGPERAVFVGDTTWDIDAASRAGLS